MSKLNHQIDAKLKEYWSRNSSLLSPHPPWFSLNWELADAFRMLRANARWFSFGIRRQIGISLDLWRVVTGKEMTALKPVRRASPESTLEWIMLIRDNNVSTAYSRLAKFWIRLNDKHWLSVKFLHMVFLCSTRLGLVSIHCGLPFPSGKIIVMTLLLLSIPVEVSLIFSLLFVPKGHQH